MANVQNHSSSPIVSGVNDPEDVASQVQVLWYYWSFDLAGQIGLLGITGWMGWTTGGMGLLPDWFTWLPGLILVIACPASHVARAQLYKLHWRGDAVSVEGYGSAFWCHSIILNMVSLVGAISFSFAGVTWPAAIAVGAGLLIQIAAHPIATPMQGQPPRLGVQDE
ncbi:MAG: hypothetical protein AAF086_08825 [Planctomycetota bacterium]